MRGILTKRLTIQGFIIFDHEHRWQAFHDDVAGWIREGLIVYREDFVDGLENAVGAFQGLLEGRNLGKLIEIGAGPFSQTKTMLSTLKDFDLESITFAEPNIFRYKTEVPRCTYKTGRLKGFEQYPLHLISKRVEELEFVETMDTVVQINVVEHVTNAVTFFGKSRLSRCAQNSTSHVAQKRLFGQ